MQKRFRPQCELLEGRVLPSTLFVTTMLDVVDPVDGKRSLREAISLANTTPGADVIVIPAGLHKIAIDGVAENDNATGDFDVTEDVVIRGAGAGLTVIDGNRRDRHFDLLGPINVRFNGITLRNGGTNAIIGGAVQALSANLTMVNCVVRDNRGILGGGINNESGNVHLTGCTVARNIADNDGGGVRVGSGTLTAFDSSLRRNLSADLGGGVRAGTVEATGCTFTDNVSASGGGIYAATANVTKCTISGNRAGGGGGLFAVSGATLTKCTISGNTSSVNGGGIVLGGNSMVTQSTIWGNTAAGEGGGVIAITLTLTNSTISGNVALTHGGGVSIVSGATISSCTIADNIAGGNGGGLHRNPTSIGEVEVRNTIVAANFGFDPDISGTFVSLGNNLIGSSAGGTGFVNGVSGDIVGSSHNPIDPKLGPLADNGGPTKTHALLRGSRAIDHGDNSLSSPTDQRGFLRKKDGNGDGITVVDIGSFER